MSDEDRKCLQERKYWAFLLSSIVTFCVSMLLVVGWKLLQTLCCTRGAQRQREQEEKCRPLLNERQYVSICDALNVGRHTIVAGGAATAERDRRRDSHWLGH